MRLDEANSKDSPGIEVHHTINSFTIQMASSLAQCHAGQSWNQLYVQDCQSELQLQTLKVKLESSFER